MISKPQQKVLFFHFDVSHIPHLHVIELNGRDVYDDT